MFWARKSHFGSCFRHSDKNSSKFFWVYKTGFRSFLLFMNKHFFAAYHSAICIRLICPSTFPWSQRVFHIDVYRLCLPNTSRECKCITPFFSLIDIPSCDCELGTCFTSWVFDINSIIFAIIFTKESTLFLNALSLLVLKA